MKQNFLKNLSRAFNFLIALSLSSSWAQANVEGSTFSSTSPNAVNEGQTKENDFNTDPRASIKGFGADLAYLGSYWLAKKAVIAGGGYLLSAGALGAVGTIAAPVGAAIAGSWALSLAVDGGINSLMGATIKDKSKQYVFRPITDYTVDFLADNVANPALDWWSQPSSMDWAALGQSGLGMAKTVASASYDYVLSPAYSYAKAGVTQAGKSVREGVSSLFSGVAEWWSQPSSIDWAAVGQGGLDVAKTVASASYDYVLSPAYGYAEAAASQAGKSLMDGAFSLLSGVMDWWSQPSSIDWAGLGQSGLGMAKSVASASYDYVLSPAYNYAKAGVTQAGKSLMDGASSLLSGVMDWWSQPSSMDWAALGQSGLGMAKTVASASYDYVLSPAYSYAEAAASQVMDGASSLLSGVMDWWSQPSSIDWAGLGQSGLGMAKSVASASYDYVLSPAYNYAKAGVTQAGKSLMDGASSLLSGVMDWWSQPSSMDWAALGQSGLGMAKTVASASYDYVLSPAYSYAEAAASQVMDGASSLLSGAMDWWSQPSSIDWAAVGQGGLDVAKTVASTGYDYVLSPSYNYGAKPLAQLLQSGASLGYNYVLPGIYNYALAPMASLGYNYLLSPIGQYLKFAALRAGQGVMERTSSLLFDAMDWWNQPSSMDWAALGQGIADGGRAVLNGALAYGWEGLSRTYEFSRLLGFSALQGGIYFTKFSMLAGLDALSFLGSSLSVLGWLGMDVIVPSISYGASMVASLLQNEYVSYMVNGGLKKIFSSAFGEKFEALLSVYDHYVSTVAKKVAEVTAGKAFEGILFALSTTFTAFKEHGELFTQEALEKMQGGLHSMRDWVGAFDCDALINHVASVSAELMDEGIPLFLDAVRGGADYVKDHLSLKLNDMSSYIHGWMEAIDLAQGKEVILSLLRSGKLGDYLQSFEIRETMEQVMQKIKSKVEKTTETYLPRALHLAAYIEQAKVKLAALDEDFGLSDKIRKLMPVVKGMGRLYLEQAKTQMKQIVGTFASKEQIEMLGEKLAAYMEEWELKEKLLDSIAQAQEKVLNMKENLMPKEQWEKKKDQFEGLVKRLKTQAQAQWFETDAEEPVPSVVRQILEKFDAATEAVGKIQVPSSLRRQESAWIGEGWFF